jgi:hypothetical protein
MVPPGELAVGHSDIVTPRGFVRLVWTLVAADGTTPATCPSSSTIGASPGLDQRAICTTGSAVTSGMLVGTHDITVRVFEASYQPRVLGMGTVSVPVVADVITEVPVTIVLN